MALLNPLPRIHYCRYTKNRGRGTSLTPLIQVEGRRPFHLVTIMCYFAHVTVPVTKE